MSDPRFRNGCPVFSPPGGSGGGGSPKTRKSTRPPAGRAVQHGSPARPLAAQPHRRGRPPRPAPMMTAESLWGCVNIIRQISRDGGTGNVYMHRRRNPIGPPDLRSKFFSVCNLQGPFQCRLTQSVKKCSAMRPLSLFPLRGGFSWTEAGLLPEWPGRAPVGADAGLQFLGSLCGSGCRQRGSPRSPHAIWADPRIVWDDESTARRATETRPGLARFHARAAGRPGTLAAGRHLGRGGWSGRAPFAPFRRPRDPL